MEDGMKEIRAKIYDWLIIVNKRLKYSDATYILAIDILDKIIEKYDYDVDDIHMLSIACLLIAAKYDEIEPFSIQQGVENIGYKKFTKNDLKDSELFILTSLKFQIPKNYFIEFITLIISHISCNVLLKPKKVESDGKLPFIRRQKYPPTCIEKKSVIRVTMAPNPNTYTTVEKSLKVQKSVVNIIPNKKLSKNQIEKSTLVQDVENEYENILFLFTICIYKMLTLEYDIYRNGDPLLLCFSVVYFAINELNKIFDGQGKLLLNVFFDLAEKFGVRTKKIIDFVEVIYSVYYENTNSRGKFKYLDELELNYFIN